MKRGILVLAAALAAFVGAAPAQAQCVAMVRYAGASYFGSPIEASGGRPLQGVVRPGCNDVVSYTPDGGEPPRAPDEAVDASRIAGVPARMALGVGGRVYLAPGYLPQLNSHPLHYAWSWWRGRFTPDPHSCGPVWHVQAIVADARYPGFVPISTAGGRERLLHFEPDARVRGLDRGGYPYLAEGQRISAVVRTCRSGLLASRVAAA